MNMNKKEIAVAALMLVTAIATPAHANDLEELFGDFSNLPPMQFYCERDITIYISPADFEADVQPVSVSGWHPKVYHIDKIDGITKFGPNMTFGPYTLIMKDNTHAYYTKGRDPRQYQCKNLELSKSWSVK
jgi:hypothetical protein